MTTRERLLNDDSFLLGCLYRLQREKLLRGKDRAILYSFYSQHQRKKSLTPAQIKTCREKLTKFLRDIISIDDILPVKNLTKTKEEKPETIIKEIIPIQPDCFTGELYQFQKEGIGWLEAHDGCGLLADQMGLGKTVQSLGWLAMHPEARPALMIVPASVKRNWQREINKWFKEPQHMSILSGRTPDESLLSPNINIINYDIIAPEEEKKLKKGEKRKERKRPMLPGWRDTLISHKHQAVILDECFPFKTKIMTEKGYLFIGDIVEKKLDIKILSYDFKEKELLLSSITHYIKNIKANNLIEIKHSFGKIKCTSNHKIWSVTDEKYKPADSFEIGEKMQILWYNHKKQIQNILLSSLLGKMDKGTSYNKKELHNMWKRIFNQNSKSKKILWKKLFSKMANVLTRNKRKNIYKRKKSESISEKEKLLSNEKRKRTCQKEFRQNAEEQPNEQYKNLFQNDGDKKNKRDSAYMEGKKRRKWAINRTSDFIKKIIGKRMGLRICNIFRNCSKSISYQLQSGYCKQETEISNRSGWERPQNFKTAKTGFQKNQNVRTTEVEDIKIYQSGNHGQPRKGSEENKYVYNLEIKNTHNYFAENVLVSNCHKIKETSANRTKATKRVAKKINHRIALTGTPVLNRPIEIYNAINLICPKMFTHWEFVQRYCDAKRGHFGGWDFTGSTNRDELHQILKKDIMLRRLKKDVLKELPEKQIMYTPLDIDNRKEYLKAENFFIDWLKTKDRQKAERAKGAQQLVQIEYLKQLSAEGKLSACIEWIDDFLETGEKLVLFATHKKILDGLQDKFKKECVRISGGVSLANRDKAIQDFQHKDSIRLIINNIDAGGLGIDGLQNVCSNACFLEFPWSPTDMEQAMDRLHRIGQFADSINIYLLYGLNTIDEKIIKLMQAKLDIINAVIDGKHTEQHIYISELLSDLKNKKSNNLYI